MLIKLNFNVVVIVTFKLRDLNFWQKTLTSTQRLTVNGL